MATRSLPATMRHDRLFYSSMGFAGLLVVFAGFAPSYYLAPWFDTPPGTPAITGLLHVHGAVFTLWMLLSTVQPLLIAGRRRDLHRALGYGGAGLALLMVGLGLYAGARAMHVGFIGLGDGRAFFAVPFFSMLSFAGIVALGIARREQPAAHKRLMLLANTQIVEAAFARLFVFAGLPGNPLFLLASDFAIFAGAAFDMATRGRVHAVWIWGGLFVFTSQIVRLAISGTEGWMAFATAIKAMV